MKSLQRIFAIVRKEVRQLRRDRLTFGMIIGIPVIQLLMFGYAINMDVRNLDAAVADMSGSSASRQMVMDMEQTQIIKIIAQVSDADELEHMMRQGKISVGILIPPDFDRRMQQPDRSAMQLLVDGTDTVVQGAAAQLAQVVQQSRTSPYNDRPPVVGELDVYRPDPAARLSRFE